MDLGIPHPPGQAPAWSDSTERDKRDRRDFLRQERHEEVEQRAQDVEATAEIKCQDDEILKTLVRILGISEEQMKKLKTSNRGYALSTMAYLLVIVGCELDLYGFSMAFSTYWNMDHVIIKLLLIICPLGYLVATALYLCRDSKGPSTTKDPHAVVPQSIDKRGEGMVDLGKREPITLEFYHFIPLVRYYMVVKEKTASDVEGIFRINSLSSFSLGVAQICSMVFLLCVDQQKPDIFVIINIGSQVINWTITGLYFGTSVVSMMKMTVRVDALIYNSKQDLVDTHQQYLEVSIAAAREKAGKKAKDKLEDIERGIKNEIRHLTNQKDVDLDAYPAQILLNCLGKLREIQYHSFRQYGKE